MHWFLSQIVGFFAAFQQQIHALRGSAEKSLDYLLVKKNLSIFFPQTIATQTYSSLWLEKKPSIWIISWLIVLTSSCNIPDFVSKSDDSQIDDRTASAYPLNSPEFRFESPDNLVVTRLSGGTDTGNPYSGGTDTGNPYSGGSDTGNPYSGGTDTGNPFVVTDLKRLPSILIFEGSPQQDRFLSETPNLYLGQRLANENVNFLLLLNSRALAPQSGSAVRYRINGASIGHLTATGTIRQELPLTVNSFDVVPGKENSVVISESDLESGRYQDVEISLSPFTDPFGEVTVKRFQFAPSTLNGQGFFNQEESSDNLIVLKYEEMEGLNDNSNDALTYVQAFAGYEDEYFTLFFHQELAQGVAERLGDTLLDDADPAEMIGFWSMTNTAPFVEDSSGNGHAGTLDGAVKIEDGWILGALRFDGIDDRMLIDSPDSLLSSERLSISFWIRPSAGTSPGTVLAAGSKDNGIGLWLEPYPSDRNGYLLKSKRTYRGTTSQTNGAFIQSERWIQVIMIYDTPRCLTKLYLDGVLADAGMIGGDCSASVAPKQISGNLSIGSDTDGSKTFGGVLDEIKIYRGLMNGDQRCEDAGLPDCL